MTAQIRGTGEVYHEREPPRLVKSNTSAGRRPYLKRLYFYLAFARLMRQRARGRPREEFYREECALLMRCIAATKARREVKPADDLRRQVASWVQPEERRAAA